MFSTVLFVTCVGLASANPGAILGLTRVHDDGQRRPELDGSASQLVHDDGSHRFRRSYDSYGYINPNSLPVPADTHHVALAKQAILIQQNTEGLRNILGGGIPLNLPADTYAVAIGKQAHALAHARQNAIIQEATRVATASPYGQGLGGIHGYGGNGYGGIHGYSGLGGISGIYGIW